MSEKAQFAYGRESMGWRPVFLVDEHGCLLHTEPVCTVPERWHGWFLHWIQNQEVPENASWIPLKFHPMLNQEDEKPSDKTPTVKNEGGGYDG